MPQRSSQSAHRVALIVDENSNPFEMSCAIEVFGLRRPELGRDLYELRLCAVRPATQMRDGLFTLSGVAGLETVEGAGTVIVPNRPDTEAPRPPELLQALRRAHARGARLIGFCSGAFTIGDAGLLDGRRAACHWMWADAFRTRFPKATLEPDVLFVDDGDILTASGSASALDLGLHVVRRDYGTAIANAVSRRLVFAARDGGQRQFIERPVPAVADESLAPLLAWAREHLDQPLTVTSLAARAAVSPATLHRRFRAQLGTSPLAWLTTERVTHACRLIEAGETRLDVIARRSGLGTGTNLRARMHQQTGLGPSDYRRRFGPAAGEEDPKTSAAPGTS